MSVPEFLVPLFWDVDKGIDTDEYWFFVIERVLEYGNMQSLNWLFASYTKEQIKQVVSESSGLSQKTASCWRNYFELREEEVSCLRKSSDKETTNTWSY